MFPKPGPTLEEIEEYNFVVNQTFRIEEEFFKFYNDYGEEKGFSVRKGDVRRWTDTGEIKWRRYLCSNEGFRSEEFFERTDRIRTPRDLTRCGCPAKLEIKRTARDGMWYVNNFVDAHDHPFIDPQHVGVLWSHRGLNEAQKAESIALALGGLRPYQVLEVMQKSQGGVGADGILSREMYNFIAKEKKRRVQGSDAEYVQNYMAARKDENPEFYFEYTRDDEMHLQNIF